MARLTAVLLLAAASSAASFSAGSVLSRRDVGAGRLSATADEDTDFDAPVPLNPATASSVLDHEIVVVDDECYLGKYGQHPDCVDFDPMHNIEAKVEIETKAKSEMPDFSDLFDSFKNSLSKIFN
mmetsp:Transcript_5514/g.12034  ORF Transcript_5514/g.12034 Transcript_5514/m.12034 type:complete len:125 (-) Transcript_5514:287-661(-)|eukprot:CAMPEP_0172532896 /NCGR_PEP_ID=MMETSP1067-20121228/5782_1 /TAXON_ID=265564 ORGANISM="Thalassiosira punctigera, Strain Tpunct2005C2" /NCGR_SAMPLE_ID=MMETSP1067 /ASSEMBLY_ACC=CAM_ASM_000444 /LENGTH=124 /DNA_ID=CAMNT_0013317457 /DNA_START=32 /DNA_END=406 /DNA_ORIENTATION=-